MISDELRRQAIRETRENGQARCVTTRDGRAVRVYADDGYGGYPIQGAILDPDGWCQAPWAANGQWNRYEVDEVDDLRDLIPARRSGEATLYVYDAESGPHACTYDARHVVTWPLIARVPVKWTEGDGI